MAAKRGSSRRWLQRQRRDQYVKRAQQSGLRSRAAFKLQEIDDKDQFLRRGGVVVDLGASPGGWSQLAAQRVGDSGVVIALDRLDMPALAGVEFIQGDFTETEVLDRLNQVLNGREVDVVLCDLAPNISGLKAVDQPRAMYLAELALEFAEQSLRPGGVFLVKVFQGEGFEEFLRHLRREFTRVVTRKPKASRSESREIYLLGVGRKV